MHAQGASNKWVNDGDPINALMVDKSRKCWLPTDWVRILTDSDNKTLDNFRSKYRLIFKKTNDLSICKMDITTKITTIIKESITNVSKLELDNTRSKTCSEYMDITNINTFTTKEKKNATQNDDLHACNNDSKAFGFISHVLNLCL